MHARSLVYANGVITWTCADTAGLESQDLDGIYHYVEGFVPASTAILLGKLKQMLPDNQMTNAGKII